MQDYKGSGFDRGHLAPAANHKVSFLWMEETFNLSNIASQNPQFNPGYWSKLEKHVRDLTNSYSVVHVYTGNQNSGLSPFALKTAFAVEM